MGNSSSTQQQKEKKFGVLPDLRPIENFNVGSCNFEINQKHLIIMLVVAYVGYTYRNEISKALNKL